MLIVRVFLGVVSAGMAVFLGYVAYWSWALTIWSASRGWSGSNSLKLLGVTLSFPVGMTLLIVLTLAFAAVAIYALFLAKSDH